MNLDEAMRCIFKNVVARANTSNLRSHLRINHPAAFAWLSTTHQTKEELSTTSGQRKLEDAKAFVRCDVPTLQQAAVSAYWHSDSLFGVRVGAIL